MKRYLKFLMVSVTVVMLLLATTATVFGGHLPGQDNPADDKVSVAGHFASCTAQGIIVHSVPETLNQDFLHQLYHEECADLADHEYPL